MASEAALVARRLQHAQTDNKIDLNGCGLMKIPVAMFMMLKDIPVQFCSMSHNQLQMIPPRFPTTFNGLKELNFSNNKISVFPEEMNELSELELLDISSNCFTSLPAVIYQYNKLQKLIVNNNDITEVDVDRLAQMTSLQEINLSGNTLSQGVKSRLRQTNLQVLLDIEDDEL